MQGKLKKYWNHNPTQRQGIYLTGDHDGKGNQTEQLYAAEPGEYCQIPIEDNPIFEKAIELGNPFLKPYPPHKEEDMQVQMERVGKPPVEKKEPVVEKPQEPEEGGETETPAEEETDSEDEEPVVEKPSKPKKRKSRSRKSKKDK